MSNKSNQTAKPSRASRTSAKQSDRSVLRMPREYHEQLAFISRRNHRSMNAQITLLLERFVNVEEQAMMTASDRVGLDPHARDAVLDESALKVVEKFKRFCVEKQKALLDLLD